MGANLRGAASESSVDSVSESNTTAPQDGANGSSQPRWLKSVRSAVALPAPEAAATPSVHSTGRVLRPNSSLVFATCCFTSPSCPNGPGVVVERALVDTGSSDCELREGLLKCLPPLPVVARGVTYETSTGDEAYDAYEVVLTVNGRRCAAVLTIVPEERFQANAEEPCSDEALLGHMAIAALGLDVHCRSRSMKAQSAGAAKAIPALPQGDLGQLHVASSRFYGFVPPLPASSVNVSALPVGRLWTEGQRLPPRWLPGTGCAMPVFLDSLETVAQRAPSELDLHGKPVVPVTYATCTFLSPLSPGLHVSVNMALVDSGSSDCELRQGFLDRLGRLPTVAEGVVYETVAGRHVFDSYEVLLSIGGRICACAVTGVPEERFHPGAEDPASDEAVIGLAALSALDLVVTCGQHTVIAAIR